MKDWVFVSIFFISIPIGLSVSISHFIHTRATGDLNYEFDKALSRGEELFFSFNCTDYVSDINIFIKSNSSLTKYGGTLCYENQSIYNDYVPMCDSITKSFGRIYTHKKIETIYQNPPNLTISCYGETCNLKGKIYSSIMGSYSDMGRFQYIGLIFGIAYYLVWGLGVMLYVLFPILNQ